MGKVVVITGGTSGIGRVAAEALARGGSRIILVARDPSRAQATLARLKELAPGVAHTAYFADLSELRSTARVASEIAAAEPRIDILINNAGAIFASRQVTSEGLERTLATNHMSYFVLTAGLLDRLTASAPARIVNTASDAHRSGHIDFSDLQSRRGYSAFSVYGTTKLCNILFTRALAKRLSGKGVTANCFHPGFVASRFGSDAGGIYRAAIRVAQTLFAISEEKGAKTLIYLATSPEVANISGEYFYKGQVTSPTAEARDDAIAERLWAESEKLAEATIPGWRGWA